MSLWDEINNNWLPAVNDTVQQVSDAIGTVRGMTGNGIQTPESRTPAAVLPGTPAPQDETTRTFSVGALWETYKRPVMWGLGILAAVFALRYVFGKK